MWPQRKHFSPRVCRCFTPAAPPARGQQERDRVLVFGAIDHEIPLVWLNLHRNKSSAISPTESPMNTLARYLEIIVDPTWDDFHTHRDSVRHAFLACVAIYHSVDRFAEENGKKARHFRRLWGKENMEFQLVDIIAHHFKHVLSDDEQNKGNRPGIPIGLALGFNEAGDTMDLRNLYYVIRDAVRFVHRKAETEHPGLPEPSCPNSQPATFAAASKTQ